MRRGLPVVVASIAGAIASIAIVVACSVTPDPRPGSGRPSFDPRASAPGGGGLVDVDVPDAPASCGPAPAASGAFTKAALLAAAADCAAWHACTFQNSALALRSAVRGYGDAPDESHRASAAAAWKAAMSEWSALELFQFGPAAPSSLDKYQGRGIRSYIHPWPDLDRCQVETQVATKSYEADGLVFVPPNGRGLFALEYLLFYPGSDVSCLPNSAAAKAWGTIDLARAKRDYATATADNVLALALELANVWAAGGENFKAKLLAFDRYGSEQETLNVVAWSLLYVDKEIKDWKLAPRAGVAADPKPSESPFAGVEIEDLRMNLRGFRALFQGCGDGGAGIGFDDWLTASGSGQLAADIASALDAFAAAADAFPPFAQASPASFTDLYAKAKALADLLKNSMFGSASAINLKLPGSAASDTD